MAITISGSGITSANIADGTIVNADVNDVAASKLTGALPAIDGSSLTNLPGGGKVLQAYTYVDSTRQNPSMTSFNDIFSGSFTKISSTSKLIINTQVSGWGNDWGEGSQRFGIGASTSNELTNLYVPTYSKAIPGLFIISGNTQTGSLTWALQWRYESVTVINPNSTDVSYYSSQQTSSVTIWEVEA